MQQFMAFERAFDHLVGDSSSAHHGSVITGISYFAERLRWAENFRLTL
jgi:hypothetical protein